MRKVYHEAIFYPSESRDLDKLVSRDNNILDASAIIVPHQDLRKCAPLYNKAFSLKKDIKSFLILAPLHSGTLENDSAELFFEDKSDAVETPLGTVRLRSLGFRDASSYLLEEPGPELPLLYIAKYYPESTVSVLFFNMEKAKDVKEGIRILKNKLNPLPFFIISSNLSSTLATRDEEKERLILSDHLMEAYTKKKTGICAAPAIEAVNGLLDGEWVFLGYSDDTKVGHAAFYKRTR